ncbi:uncharacterized protein VP01_372g7 [Puccinia sorghi]|uniref:Uncharacterized protein n=1 Tax=Puccinia sorghi TaxID=27349 RepID=A0A0L6UU49_9BASI|nr:uncharacterized protein VP01_372g7 [Puccinia sorghi]
MAMVISKRFLRSMAQPFEIGQDGISLWGLEDILRRQAQQREADEGAMADMEMGSGMPHVGAGAAADDDDDYFGGLEDQTDYNGHCHNDNNNNNNNNKNNRNNNNNNSSRTDTQPMSSSAANPAGYPPPPHHPLDAAPSDSPSQPDHRNLPPGVIAVIIIIPALAALLSVLYWRKKVNRRTHLYAHGISQPDQNHSQGNPRLIIPPGGTGADRPEGQRRGDRMRRLMGGINTRPNRSDSVRTVPE